MERFAIRGGVPLKGDVTVSGAKNAALGILAAATMANEPVTVRNLPKVSDVEVLLKSIHETGAKIESLNDHEVIINGGSICRYVVGSEYIRSIRAGYYMLGALLGKYHYALVALPGGCTIGSRPMDQHLKGFRALGATAKIENNMVHVEAETLHGAHIYFDTVSVGATINVMMAAVLATGRTVLENVAKEPHVVDVANFLNSMGAKIKGAGTDVIRIDGVVALHSSDYALIPDQIEAGTFMAMAAATHGNVKIHNVIPKHLECITSKLREIGCEVREFDDAIRVIANKTLKATKIKTLPYPGFPTDMQPQLTVVLSMANGVSTVHETIFENRFKYVAELKRMGVDITVENNMAIIKGVEKLTGADMEAPDLRAGAALIIAALSAEGDSIVRGGQYVLRGYENFAEKIQALGGQITCVKTDSAAKRFFLRVAE